MKTIIMKLFICILILTFLTGCWNSREISSLAMIISLGIDKSEKGILLSAQVLNPKAISTKSAKNEAPVILFFQEGKDISEILRKLSEKLSRIPYCTHLRQVVFGESLIKEGIKDYLDFFTREHEFRTDFYFSIAKNAKAYDVLKILTPIESIPGIHMYNTLKISEQIWAPTKSIRIIELVNTIISDGENSVLPGIEIIGSVIKADSIDELKKSDPNNFLKFNGLAIMKKDKLVGWLSEDESKGHNYITNRINESMSYIETKKHRIAIEIISAESSIQTDLKNEKPKIHVNIKVDSSINAMGTDIDVTKRDEIDKLKELIQKKITTFCFASIKKAKKFKSDIFGFGENIHRNYPQVWQKLKDNWGENFTKLPITVKTTVNIKRIGAVSKSYFKKEKE